ncbi:hypothetical protein [Mycoplasma procyoni]|uniref:hypothetical protein n=1 Tax=Mycoplasma procyoni TaxID=568784 RepID=UPI00197C127D|nr:hypothetical protein [Mycoplasma procyoni]MBN3534610.1 hypothetical protein [Mycoplasma procyoni]
MAKLDIFNFEKQIQELKNRGILFKEEQKQIVYDFLENHHYIWIIDNYKHIIQELKTPEQITKIIKQKIALNQLFPEMHDEFVCDCKQHNRDRNITFRFGFLEQLENKNKHFSSHLLSNFIKLEGRIRSLVFNFISFYMELENIDSKNWFEFLEHKIENFEKHNFYVVFQKTKDMFENSRELSFGSLVDFLVSILKSNRIESEFKTTLIKRINKHWNFSVLEYKDILEIENSLIFYKDLRNHLVHSKSLQTFFHHTQMKYIVNEMKKSDFKDFEYIDYNEIKFCLENKQLLPYRYTIKVIKQNGSVFEVEKFIQKHIEQLCSMFKS